MHLSDTFCLILGIFGIKFLVFDEYLRWLKTVSGTFQDVEFDGS